MFTPLDPVPLDPDCDRGPCYVVHTMQSMSRLCSSIRLTRSRSNIRSRFNRDPLFDSPGCDSCPDRNPNRYPDRDLCVWATHTFVDHTWYRSLCHVSPGWTKLRIIQIITPNNYQNDMTDTFQLDLDFSTIKSSKLANEESNFTHFGFFYLHITKRINKSA